MSHFHCFHLSPFSTFSPFTFHRFHLSPLHLSPLSLLPGWPGLTIGMNRCILKFIIWPYSFSPYHIFTVFTFHLVTVFTFHLFTVFTFHPFTFRPFSFCLADFHLSPLSPSIPLPFAGLARADHRYESLHTKIYNLALLVFTLSHFHCFHLSPFSTFSPFTLSPFSSFTFASFTPVPFAGLARADHRYESLYTKIKNVAVLVSSPCHLFTVFTFHLFTVFTVFILLFFTFSPLLPFIPLPFAALARAGPRYELLYTKI